MKVIASSLRKGNILDIDDRLYVVLKAESFHPGKGTPTNHGEMSPNNDGDGFHFMNSETFDQVTVQEDVVGDGKAYLQPEMKVMLSVHEGNVVAIEMPQRATLEVVETEAVTKGQTASSSYKPAVLSNGVRTSVPPHITTGTRIVVMTADGSYVERAKD